MIKYTKKSTKVERSLTNRVLPKGRKVRIRLAKKNDLEDLVLTLNNIFYLSNSLLNFVSLDFFNNAEIYHHNKDQILYNQSN